MRHKPNNRRLALASQVAATRQGLPDSSPRITPTLPQVQLRTLEEVDGVDLLARPPQLTGANTRGDLFEATPDYLKPLIQDATDAELEALRGAYLDQLAANMVGAYTFPVVEVIDARPPSAQRRPPRWLRWLVDNCPCSICRAGGAHD